MQKQIYKTKLDRIHHSIFKEQATQPFYDMQIIISGVEIGENQIDFRMDSAIAEKLNKDIDFDIKIERKERNRLKEKLTFKEQAGQGAEIARVTVQEADTSLL